MTGLPNETPEPQDQAASRWDATANVASPSERRRKIGPPNLLLGGALLLLLLCILARNFLDVKSPNSRDLSDAALKTFDALRATKTAVSLHSSPAFITQSFETAPVNQPATPWTVPPTSTSPQTSGNGAAPRWRTERRYRNRPSRTITAEDEAIQRWRALARSRTGRPSDWRHLGITLFLFGRYGGMEAFSHIPEAERAVAARAQRQRAGSHTLARLQIEGALPAVPPAQEAALWQAIYGPQPLDAAQARVLRRTLAKLKLGWFEEIAAAHLYAKAKLQPEADQSARAAFGSAQQLLVIGGTQVILFLVGIACLLFFGLLLLVQKTNGPQTISSLPWTGPSPADPGYGYPSAPAMAAGASTAYGSYPAQGRYAVPGQAADTLPLPLPGGAATPFVPPLPAWTAAGAFPSRFSYRARMTAFVVYLAVFVSIGLPFRLLTPWTETWSSSLLLRLNMVLNLLLYLPVIAATLWTLRRMAGLESPTGARPSLRATLSELGFRTRRSLSDVGAGVLGYVMVMPVFLMVTLLSQWMFQKYHTPLNPVQVESMMTQNLLDRVLLLVEASIAAPIVEEMMFRGLLFPALRSRSGLVGGATLSAAVFALMHPTLPGGFLPIWTLGFAFALTYQRRDSLLPNIVMHGLHNGYVLLLAFTLFAS